MKEENQIRGFDLLFWEKICRKNNQELKHLVDEMSEEEKPILFSACEKICKNLGVS